MKQKQQFSGQWSWQFSCNSPAKTWRELVGGCLRSLAQKIDGRISLALAISTEPPISTRRKHECVLAGLNAIQAAISEEAQSECLEGLLRSFRPELFENHLEGK